MSDSKVDTIDTQTSQPESFGPSQSIATQSFDPNAFTVKSEPSISKYHDANIFSQIGYPSALAQNSFAMVSTNQPLTPHRELGIPQSAEPLIKSSNSEVKIEDSLYENNGNEQLLCPPMTAAEATILYCKDQIVAISSPNQEAFGVKVDDAQVQGNSISCSMVPINMPDKSVPSLVMVGKCWGCPAII